MKDAKVNIKTADTEKQQIILMKMKEILRLAREDSPKISICATAYALCLMIKWSDKSYLNMVDYLNECWESIDRMEDECGKIKD